MIVHQVKPREPGHAQRTSCCGMEIIGRRESRTLEWDGPYVAEIRTRAGGRRLFRVQSVWKRARKCGGWKGRKG